MPLNSARAGIARAGNMRAAYLTLNNLVYVINGVNRSAGIAADTTAIELAINDEPDTARFTILPDAGFVPVPGQLVTINNGAAGNPEFGGQIQRVTRRFERGGGAHVQNGEPDPAIDVECVDWLRLFNRTLVDAEWQGVSATEIAREILANTSGFTGDAIAAGLPTLDQFVCINEPAGVAMKRLAVACGGGFFIDPRRDVHLFGSAGEAAGRFGTAPLSITATRATLKAFTAEADNSQIRTRVIVEGAAATCPIAIPANTLFPVVFSGGQIQSLPLNGSDHIYGATTVRLRHVIVSTTINCFDGILAPTRISTLTADAAVGATTLSVSSTTGMYANGWVRVGSEVVYHGTLGGATSLATIPPSGLGSVRTPIKAGVEVTQSSYMTVPAGTLFTVQIESGAEVVLRVTANDAAAQAVIAAIEGGDGVHEHVVEDSKLNRDGATARAAAELAAFAGDLTTITWETDDQNAKPGRLQAVTYGGLSITVPITRVGLAFPVRNRIARRQCEGSTVRIAKMLDAIVTRKD